MSAHKCFTQVSQIKFHNDWFIIESLWYKPDIHLSPRVLWASITLGKISLGLRPRLIFPRVIYAHNALAQGRYPIHIGCHATVAHLIVYPALISTYVDVLHIQCVVFSHQVAPHASASAWTPSIFHPVPNTHVKCIIGTLFVITI